jgi:hypothetical protein
MKALVNRLWPLWPAASAIAVLLLIVGFFGWGILFAIDEGTANPATASTPWGTLAVGVLWLLTFPLGLIFGAIEEAMGTGGLSMFAGIVVDAWLYGFAVAAGIGKLRAHWAA